MCVCVGKSESVGGGQCFQFRLWLPLRGATEAREAMMVVSKDAEGRAQGADRHSGLWRADRG